MNWDKYKQKLQEDMNAYQSEVNPDEIWAAIEPEVDNINSEGQNNPSKRFMFFLIGLLFLSTLSTYSIYHYVWKQKDKVVLSEKTKGETTDSPNQTPIKKDENTLATNNDVLNNNINNEKQSQENKSIPPSRYKNTDKSQNHSQDKLTNANPIETLTNKPHSQNENKASRQLQAGLLQSNNTTKEQNVATTYSNQKTTQTEQPYFVNNNTATISTYSNTTKVATSSLRQQDPIPSASRLEKDNMNSRLMPGNISIAESSTSPFKPLRTTVLKEQIKTLDKANIHYFENTLIERLPKPNIIRLARLRAKNIEAIQYMFNSSKYTTKQLPEKIIRAKAFHIGLSISGGGSFITKTLSHKFASADAYLSLRNNTETPLEASHWRALLSVKHKTDFSLSLGLQGTYIAERFSLSDTLVEQTTEYGIIAYRYDLEGEKKAVMGNVPITKTTVTKQTVFNTYQLLDIPILLGYHHPIGKKWQVGGQAGVLMNLSMKSEGSILSETLVPTEIAAQQGDFFKSTVGLSYYAGLFLERQLFNNLSVSLQQSVRYFPEDFTVDTNPISQKYFLVESRLGITYWFR